MLFNNFQQQKKSKKIKIIEKVNVKSLEKKDVFLNGWVNRIRNLGSIMFFDLQYAGKQTQIIVKEKNLIREISTNIKTGDLITVSGEYQNKEISLYEKKTTEEFSQELLVKSWKIINKTTILPFEIKDNLEIKEDNKYHYRYLDLRRVKSREILTYKDKLINYIRKFFQQENFVEIETPILSQSSPEGAKTFIVPSRKKDHFYTLPQSPQIFKQVLMVSGFDKYYQIAKSFRNEDARSNRQLEFLQLDLEMSFVNEEEIFLLTEKLIRKILEKVFTVKKKFINFKKMKFVDCIKKYGTDKPDLRNPLQIISEEDDFPISLKCSKKSRYEKFGIYLPLKAYSEQLIELIKEKLNELNGYSLFKLEKRKWNFIDGNLTTVNFSKKNQQKFSDGLYLVVNDKQNVARKKLLEIKKFCNKFFFSEENSKEFKFLWITDWPLFGYDENKKKIISLRHPFTMPKEEDLLKFSSDKETNNQLSQINGRAYDLVCNGEELASGSLRIFKKELQEKVFQVLGFNKQEIEKHFGYFLKALGFAAPPHGGIAFGIERMLAVFLNLRSLKETVAFPKNIDGSCSLTGAPNKLKT